MASVPFCASSRPPHFRGRSPCAASLSSVVAVGSCSGWWRECDGAMGDVRHGGSGRRGQGRPTVPPLVCSLSRRVVSTSQHHHVPDDPGTVFCQNLTPWRPTTGDIPFPGCPWPSPLSPLSPRSLPPQKSPRQSQRQSQHPSPRSYPYQYRCRPCTRSRRRHRPQSGLSCRTLGLG